jgi:serine/threonine protein kinase
VPDVTELLPGDPLDIDKYRVVSRLGSGGQGVVFLATAPSGEKVAIKRLKLEDERTRQQFVKEVAAARRVAPFCTAQVVDVRMDGPSPYVVSEYIDGPSLQQQIDERGPMTSASLHRLAIGTITALAAIHQAGVVHRDFKPANVMLSSEGPRVIDFGIARDLSMETTVTSRIFGTPVYMAPEQLQASGVGPPTDIFAWGSVIAFAATGQTAFKAPHMMAVVHRIISEEPDLFGVPDALLPIVQRCLAKDPARRPSAQQVLAMLLGRDAPAHDLTDPTNVLVEAAHIVHDDAPATTVPNRPNRSAPAPTAEFSVAGLANSAGSRNSAGPTNGAAPPVTRPGRHAGPSELPSPPSGGRRRIAVVAGLLIPLLIVAAWGLHQFGGGDEKSATPAAAATTPAPQPSAVVTKPPTAEPTPTEKPTPETTEAPTPAVGVGAIVGAKGKCVDIWNAATDDGSPVKFFACNESPAQQWKLETDGRITALGKCLDVADGSSEDGAKMQLFTCNGSAAQIFSYNVSTHEIINVASHKCLDADLNTLDQDQTELQIWACGNTDNQKWTIG